ncbi:MAG TPA: Rieske 2Fe-2S domain-containing protein [Stenotrophobium sp.]|jgi:phenylpropionate dioxygenase-like ring-hydroxylating dioxygenase large terminal subunit|nr:Rieske 2Fe-2S domain-containing protein [Stenotrophobium sp.]
MTSKPINLKLLLESKDMERCPFPIPTGWYFVDYSENLKKEEVRNIELLDQEWVLYRTESGKVGMTDPYCAHLGAHMGHGGKVCGEHLRCPFHHWEYNTEGWCKVVPYAKRMPPITTLQPIVRTLPVQEKFGLIWCWYHPALEAPSWDLPAIPEMTEPGYVPTRRGTWTANTAIQEIAENGVDFAHLKFLHGAAGIPPAEVTFNKHVIHINMANGYIVGDGYGPGLNVFQFTQEGVTATMISYTQPITRDKSQMNMSFTHKAYPEGSKEGAIAKKLVDHMIGGAEGEESAGFESVDFIVWNNKKYRAKPLLCDGDGPIIQYREWFKQFYNEAPKLDAA